MPADGRDPSDASGPAAAFAFALAAAAACSKESRLGPGGPPITGAKGPAAAAAPPTTAAEGNAAEANAGGPLGAERAVALVLDPPPALEVPAFGRAVAGNAAPAFGAPCAAADALRVGARALFMQLQVAGRLPGPQAHGAT